MRWTGVPRGDSVASRLEWVAYTRSEASAGRGFHFVVVRASDDDGEVLGACDVRLPDREDPRIGEVGYLLVASCRGRGVMSSALRLLLGWSFGGPLRLERVQALTHPDNVASQRVLERLGFTREGMLRSHRAGPDGREDRLIWSLLPIDWRAP